ncbi:MAG: hypothetical protein AAFZ15_26290 [Bacteroidota bacterium]
MAIFRYIPLMGVVLILYNVLAMSPSFSWNETFDTMYLPSGGEVALSFSEAFIAFALVVLFVEVIKSTSISNHAITEQVLSVLVFIAFLFQYLNSKEAAEPTFFILTLMSLVEVLAGFIILTKVARRDINFGG